MNVVDKIVTEWAYRCEKGYPDINNPEDLKILNEIYAEYGIVLEVEESRELDYDTEISNLLSSLSDSKKKDLVYRYLVKLNKDENRSDEEVDEKIEDILTKKKVDRQYTEYITLLASKYKISERLLDYLEKPEITLHELEQQNNLVTLFSKTDFPPKFTEKLINTTGKGIGKGELALICIIKDCENTGGKRGETQGDIKIGGKSIELKMGPAQLVPHHISGYGSKPVRELNDIFGNEYNFAERKQWVTLLQDLYKTAENPDDFLLRVNKMLKNFYSGYVKPITKDIIQGKGLSRHIMDNLAQAYIGESKNIMLIDERTYRYIFIGDYKEYQSLADNGKFAVSYPDKFPRIVYRAS